MTGGTLSAAGEALHRLPAIEARPWICVRADQVDALDDPGPGARKGFVLAEHDARGGGADHKKVAILADPDQVRDFLDVDDQIGVQRPDLSWTSRSVPPDNGFARPAAPARALMASSTVAGAVKLRLGMLAPDNHKGTPPHWQAGTMRPDRNDAQAYTTMLSGVKRYVDPD